MPENTELTIQVQAPAELVAIVPQLLGFTPEDSMVVIGLEPPRDRVKVSLRYDLPDPGDDLDAGTIALHAASVLTSAGVTDVVAVGYGPATRVDLVADALCATFGPSLHEVLRVQDGRYWSYMCTSETCCPNEGTPFRYPAAAHDKGALFDYPSGTPVLASRDELATTVAPVTGDQAVSIRRAFAALTANPPGRDGGVDAITAAIKDYRRDHWITSPSTIAYLLFSLKDLMVRDMAWSYMDPDFKDAHLKLWTDLTRYAVPGLPAAAPASLLAFCAWQAGNGALANVALDRALADDPDYSMALLLRQVITSGAPPSIARLPMSPEDVAASYADQSETTS